MNNSKKTKQSEHKHNFSQEELGRLGEFFLLLRKIDKRNNPEKYKNNSKKKKD